MLFGQPASLSKDKDVFSPRTCFVRRRELGKAENLSVRARVVRDEAGEVNFQAELLPEISKPACSRSGLRLPDIFTPVPHLYVSLRGPVARCNNRN